MLDLNKLNVLQGFRATINEAYRVDEKTLLIEYIKKATLDAAVVRCIVKDGRRLVEDVRKEHTGGGIDSFMLEYDLSGEEGIALMCLAEALLRVPDSDTIDNLIKDKIGGADWKAHKGKSSSYFVNATTWALMLTGKVLTPEKSESNLGKALMKLVNRSSETVVRASVNQAMRILSKQFVTGRTIDEALKRAQDKEKSGYRYSYDMLGEAALTETDAERYLQAYKDAIIAIGEKAAKMGSVYDKPGISIKLSALHPRYEENKRQRILDELAPRLLELAQLAKRYDIGLTIDAEESERLDLSLDLIECVFKDKSLAGWNGFGMALQSYQKRAFYVLDWIADLARSQNRRIMVRLIKGAYWDSEIKNAQMDGLSGYPVFTRKVFTDVSFQACAKKILTLTDAIFPQFATHNAYSIAMILNIVGDYRDFEFQCLHGMGEALYQQIVPKKKYGIPCRIYAPVGSHEDLLPYLVRRLLENGANSSFVNRIADDKVSVSELMVDPIASATQLLNKINDNIPLPVDIFQPERLNAIGMDFSDRAFLARFQNDLKDAVSNAFKVEPMLANKHTEQREGTDAHVRLDTSYSIGVEPILANKHTEQREGTHVHAPFDTSYSIGKVIEASHQDIESALVHAQAYFPTWSNTNVTIRAECLERFANLLEMHQTKLMALLCIEAGKTMPDAIAEVREAVDFCRYYAVMANKLMGKPLILKGYTGESNTLSLHARGLVLCISPWNFPLAIFVGQVVAAIVTGNCVLAKPAEQTPLIAGLAVNLMHEAEIPKPVIQLLPGTGVAVGAPLVADKRIKAVIFTGSTQTAAIINQTLAKRGGEIIPLIAETGGQNSMIVDSTALLEQVVVDVMNSAFGSAGQRCSALRVIYIQEEVHPRFIDLLKGAMAELDVNNPALLTTDIGPVIDQAALNGLENHVRSMLKKHALIYQTKLHNACDKGYFMPPTAIEIDSMNALKQEVFGPILHVITYKKDKLDDVIDEINSTGYGLTCGIHSRINETAEYIKDRVHVGNCYINRNMIGAVVGLQPFGGEGLSGTGPKAGGPQYLLRLCHERTCTTDTTAAGGNASLMSLPDE